MLNWKTTLILLTVGLIKQVNMFVNRDVLGEM